MGTPDPFGGGGEVRSAKGFLILYGNAPERLATALTKPGRYSFFPADLFEAVGVRLPVQYAPVEQGPAIVAGRPRVLPMLEAIGKGERNSSLFDAARWWAYAQDRGRDLDRWYEAVSACATTHNGRFPKPLPAGEVRKLAYSIGSWTWSGHGAVDHSPAAQRRRGLKSGKVRRAAVAERDGAIVQDRAAGMTQRVIAARHGLSQRAVNHILRRDASQGHCNCANQKDGVGIHLA